MKILVTGAAGFIGYHMVQTLIQRGFDVVGVDDVNDYYDVNLKYGRLQALGVSKEKAQSGEMIQSRTVPQFRFAQFSLADRDRTLALFTNEKFDRVCHLAAQAGVSYSLSNPDAYIESNIVSFMHVLEGCRHHNVQRLVYSSSSSVYGLNKTIPFSTADSTDHPMSLYAATKKSNELMAHVYSHLYGLPTIGLRFFTVYGPWGRPDMALFIFTEKILKGETITVYNEGNMLRDFTYVLDIVEGVRRVLEDEMQPSNWDAEQPLPNASPAPYRIYNIGNHNPVNLLELIRHIEKALGKKAVINFEPIRSYDVPATYADVTPLMNDYGFKPSTETAVGIQTFVDWYRSYYKV